MSEDRAEIDRVRSFNRTVTARVGALSDRVMALDRPLGQARVLWEIGPAGCEVRALRHGLGLDSGQLSRLLRSLEAAGMVKVAPSSADRRIGEATLTAAGRAERKLLDARSDELAASLLTPLTDAQRGRMVAAMGEVERLLTASIVEIRSVDPTHPDARQCVRAYFAELDQRAEAGFDPTVSSPAESDELRPPAGLQLLAYARDEPVGCACIKHQEGAPSEIKRMWVAPSARGLGLGRRMLTELEQVAALHGAEAVRLDTNRVLKEAIGMYRSAGYVEIPAFNDEPFAHHWFEKRLG